MAVIRGRAGRLGLERTQQVRQALAMGGAGFIGSHLVDSLPDESWQVTLVGDLDPCHGDGAKRGNIARRAGNEDCTLVVALLPSER